MVRGWWGVILRPLPDGSPTYGPVYITIVVPDAAKWSWEASWQGTG